MPRSDASDRSSANVVDQLGAFGLPFGGKRELNGPQPKVRDVFAAARNTVTLVSFG
jgi:hypothetical protein